jgi:hypothetical protein
MEGENMRTMVDLPEDLWRASKIRAMDERTTLKEIMVKALWAYLKTPKVKKEGQR